jgi:hypothetical protein
MRGYLIQSNGDICEERRTPLPISGRRSQSAEPLGGFTALKAVEIDVIS